MKCLKWEMWTFFGFYREFRRCKFSDYCKYKHETNCENETKRELKTLKEKVEQLEMVLKQKDKDFEKLNAIVQKLSEKVNNSKEPLDVEDESIQEEEIHNLDTTFLNPSSEVNCDVCSFVAKNVQGLKIQMKAKHTISMKYKCTLCDFETNNKKFFNDHKASKCLKSIWCHFGCGESFESEEEHKDHINRSHNKTKTYKCETCDFNTFIKKFYNDHKASKCLKVILCNLGCCESFEKEQELNEHMINIHKFKTGCWSVKRESETSNLIMIFQLSMGARGRETSASI